MQEKLYSKVFIKKVKRKSKHLIPLVLILFLSACRTLGGNASLNIVGDITSAVIRSNGRPNASPSYQSSRSSRTNSQTQVEFSAFIGNYFHRNGLLQELGDVYLTFGLEYRGFKKSDKTGWYVLWTLDHFWRTNSKILKQKFWDEDFANYMISIGWAFRSKLSKRWRFNYDIGPALNFIESDTNYTNNEGDDQDYTDLTFSFVHKINLEYIINLESDGSSKRLGVALYTYWAPNPIGKFLDTAADFKVISGASSSWLLEFKTTF
jgi:hypothetical protein